jgi:hypothetical protein
MALTFVAMVAMSAALYTVFVIVDVALGVPALIVISFRLVEAPSVVKVELQSGPLLRAARS